MTEIICPHCKSEDIKKNGFLPSGKRRYVCKTCNKYFSSEIEMKKQPAVPCIYCNGQNTIKSGKTKYNSQIWLCKDCNKKFNENKTLPPVIEEKCPYCGGDIRYKGWSNNGHSRRYICAKCRRGFSGELSELKVKIVDMPCPHCGSENIKKGGRLKSGLKRYFCNDCQKGFNEGTVIIEREPLPEKCPKCGNTHINRSGKDVKTKKQRYKCIGCGYKFVKNPTQENQRYQIHEKECPRCKHIGARRAGYTTCKSGRKQYFQCLECGHKYLENGTYRHLTEVQKRKIIYDYMRLKPITKISEKIGCSYRTAQSIIRKYQDKEVLTPQQEKMIYKFGVQLAVEPEYISPYIPCTLKKCKEYLSNFIIPKEPQIRVVLTDRERMIDKMDLDRFIT